MRTVQITLPDDAVTDLDDTQLATLAREATVVRLYERGLISSGRAAEALDMTRWGFVDLLGSYGVSFFDDAANLEDELRNAHP